MKLVATLLVCCLIVAAAKVSIALLFAACVLSLIWGAMFRPAQTFGFMAACLALAAFERMPGLFIVGSTILLSLANFKKAKISAESQIAP